MLRSLAIAALIVATPARAAIVETPLSFALDGSEYAGVLIHDDAKPAARAMLSVPNWMGINAANKVAGWKGFFWACGRGVTWEKHWIPAFAGMPSLVDCGLDRV